MDYDGAIDIWAAGCMLGELLIRIPLIQGKYEGDQFLKILSTFGNLTDKEKKYFIDKYPDNE